MKSWRHFCAALSVCLPLVGCGGSAPREQLVERTSDMNVLIVLFDAFAAEHAGFMGYERPTTPHLDRIASEGVVFDSAWTQSTGTSLSVFSFFTSRYPAFASNPQLDGDQPVFIPEELPTMAAQLASEFPRRLGVSCNPFVTSRFGYDFGFTDFFEHHERPKHGSEAERKLARHPGERMMAWLDTLDDDPWFAYLHYIEPHKPYDPPDEWIERFARVPPQPQLGHDIEPGERKRTHTAETKTAVVDLYDANLAYADHHFGALVDSLDARGEWDDTILVFMSDHGEQFWQHGQAGHSGRPFIELSQIPFFVRIPGASDLAGKRVSAPVENVDLLPTLLELAGLSPEGRNLAGRSWLPLLYDDRGAIEWFEDRGGNTRSNRSRDLAYAVRRAGYTWMRTTKPMAEHLYALEDDPREQNNLLTGPNRTRHQPMVDEFTERFMQWLDAASEQLGAAELRATSELDPTVMETLRTLGYVD